MKHTHNFVSFLDYLMKNSTGGFPFSVHLSRKENWTAKSPKTIRSKEWLMDDSNFGCLCSIECPEEPATRWGAYLDILGTRASVEHKLPSAIIPELKTGQENKNKIGRKIQPAALACDSCISVETHTQHDETPVYKQ